MIYLLKFEVIFQFLIHPEYLNETYRFIGEHATVSIDTVRKTLQGLLKDGYILQKTKKKYQFNDRNKLFEEWVAEFNKHLRPKLRQGTYKWLDPKQSWKKVQLPKGACWGGAAGAELLSNYLIADKATLYTDRPFHELSKELKIIPHPEGAVKLIEKFWKNDKEESIAPPMLIFADLTVEENPRYLETAEKIMKEHINAQL